MNDPIDVSWARSFSFFWRIPIRMISLKLLLTLFFLLHLIVTQELSYHSRR